MYLVGTAGSLYISHSNMIPSSVARFENYLLLGRVGVNMSSIEIENSNKVQEKNDRKKEYRI